jgi:hypothetical protein
MDIALNLDCIRLYTGNYMLWHRSIVRITTIFGTIILAAPVSLVNVSLANTDVANNPTEIIRSWSQYEAYDKSYRIAFPKKPTEKKDYLDTALGKIYFVEASYSDNNNYYSTSHTTYPVDPSSFDPELGLDGSRDGIAQSINMSIVSEEKTTINGFPARKVEMKGKDGALLAYLIIDPNGPTLYQVFVISANGNVRTPENLAFIDSFNFQPK